MSLEPSPVQAEEPQHSQPVFTEEVFQPTDVFLLAFFGFPLQVPVIPVGGSPPMDMVSQVECHKNKLEGPNSLPHPSGCSFDAVQCTVGFLVCEPSHAQFFIHWYP